MIIIYVASYDTYAHITPNNAENYNLRPETSFDIYLQKHLCNTRQTFDVVTMPSFLELETA